MAGACDDSRGQSEVLGAVLLLGIVVTAAVVVAGVALGSLDTVSEHSTEEAIERELLEIRSAVTDVALDGEQARTAWMSLPDGSTHSTPAESSTMSIVHHDYLGNETSGDPAVVYPETALGTVEVTHGDTRYGVEGGGLFKREGDSSTMVAPPNLALHGFTATLPIVRMEVADTTAPTQAVEISAAERTTQIFPNQSVAYPSTDKPLDNPVYNGSIELVIESDYAGGWYEFFDVYTDADLALDTSNRTLTISMDSIQEMRFEAEVTYASGFAEQGAADVDGARQSAFLPDSQPLVNAALEQAETDLTDACDFGGACTLDAGSYRHDGDLTIDEPLSIDTTAGDVTIAIDGDLTVSDDIDVLGDDGGVEYYVNGSFDVTGDAVIGTANAATEAHRNTIIMAGDGVDSGQGSATLDIVLYAPNAAIDIRGTPTITGAIMGDTVTVGGNADITFDAELETIDGVDVSGTDTPIMYLHVTEATVGIER